MMQNKPKDDTKNNSVPKDVMNSFTKNILFNNLMAEGEKYLRDSLFLKSVKSYTKV